MFRKTKGKVLRGQSRQIIFNVCNYMQKEKDEGIQNPERVQQRTAEATGTSIRTVRKILAEYKKSEGSGLHTPGKKRNKPKSITGINHFDRGIIKRCIHNYHVTEKEMPTLNKLLIKFRKDLNFNGSVSSLSKIIKELGFQWKRTENKQQVLIEKHNIRLKRIKFLQEINKYREEGRDIVYLGTSYVYMKYTQSLNEGSDKNLKKGQRVFILNAGTESGFVPGAFAILKSYTRCNSEMNLKNYEKWLKSNVINNLKPNSVIVIENTPYHNKTIDPAPTANCKRSEIQSWLKKRKISYTEEMLKPQLNTLICENGGRDKTFFMEKLFNKHNHVVLRLPPCHPDLNLIDIAGVSIREYVEGKQKADKTRHAVELVTEKVKMMGDEWIALCRKVQYIENQYRSSDHVIDAMTEEYNIYNAGSSDSESEADCSDIGSDSSGSDFDPNTDCGNELLIEIDPIIKKSCSDSDE